ncbi:MAG: hypothetical protein HFG12_08415 [Oscillibacter sp.]|jgi:hypothetical protein|nr:hypothetical protein [uncultured Oscillibacter sp.]MCI8813243.1 hypothetical protein [Oscillibacter sp.]
MESSGITGGAGAPQRQDYAASVQRETKSVYEMMRDAKEQAEARRDQLKLPKNARYGDAPMMAYAKLARARTPGEITAASGYARRKIVQLQSALRSDPDNKERIQAAIRQLQKAVRRAGKKQRDVQGEKLAESRRKKALEEKNRRKAAQLRQELTRTRALRSIRESGYIREAEMDNRTQEHLSAARLELRTQLQELTASTAGVSAAAAAHQYAAAQAVTAAEAPAAPEAGAGLDMLA